MPSAGWNLTNYRIDRGGHVESVQLVHIVNMDPYLEEWWWYRPDESRYDYGQGIIYPHNVLDLRIDRGGHIVQTLAWANDDEGDPYHWFDLNKVDKGAGTPVLPYVVDIRLDARGHVPAVYKDAWYDLNGELAA